MDTIKSGIQDIKKGAKKQYARLSGAPEPEEETSLLGEVEQASKDCCGYFKLSRKERFYGFLTSLILGFGLSCLGVFLFSVHNIVGFAVCYSLGSVCSICSSLFLFGPWYQIKNMFKETRIVATLIMLAAVGMTLFSALYWKEALLCLLFVIVQFLAVTWYGLSYIPYARRLVGGCIKRAIDI
eukprot:m.123827 g.123827  ORF g.123827 m.123827 type:complete len:183 (-) comp14458_c0_seq3:2648-3196(-)